MIVCWHCSYEDINMTAAVTSWLQAHLPEGKIPSLLEGWIEDYFYRGVQWVVQSEGLVVPTTPFGVMVNGLTHVYKCTTKSQFACALVRGLGALLTESKKYDFAKEVYHWTSEVPPEQRRLLDVYFDSCTLQLNTYQFEVISYVCSGTVYLSCFWSVGSQ